MVTLEITSADIKLIEVNNGRITKWASRALESDIFNEDVVSDPGALSNAVRQLFATNDIKERQVTVGVNGLYSLSRTVIVSTPAGQPVSGQTVLEAAEIVLPVSIEELYLSWHTIAPSDEGQQVLVIGIPKDIIDGEVRAIKMAGLDPHVLDLNTLALARVVNNAQAIVLNIGAANYDIVLVAGGMAEVLRTTAWQPESLSVEERAEQLISAVELTTSFYVTHHSNIPLDPATRLYITGNLSADHNLVNAIQDGLPYTSEALSPTIGFPEHMPAAQFAVNIGLAMKSNAKPNLGLGLTLIRKPADVSQNKSAFSVPDINMLPAGYKAWRPSARQIYYSLAAIVILALLFPTYSLTTGAMADTAVVRQRYNAINLQLEKRKAELSKREPLQKAVDQYKVVVAMRGSFVEDIETIRNIASKLGVEVDAITDSGKAVNFICKAPDFVTFRNFISALENSGLFTTPVIPPEGYPYIRGGSIKLIPKK